MSRGAAAGPFVASTSAAAAGEIPGEFQTRYRQQQAEQHPSSTEHLGGADYQSEMIKRIVEAGGGTAAALECIREDERKSARRQRHAFSLEGVITFAGGLGLRILLRGLVKDEPEYLAGLVPILVGAVMIVYAMAFVPRNGWVADYLNLYPITN